METTTNPTPGPIGADPDDLSPADRRVADMIEAMPLEELPEGAEERMIERAQSAGLVESTQPLYRLWTGGGHLPLRVHRDYYGRRTADELRAWAHARHVLPEMERAIEAGGGEGSRGSYEIGTAAGRPELTWRIEPWRPEMDPYHAYKAP